MGQFLSLAEWQHSFGGYLIVKPLIQESFSERQSWGLPMLLSTFVTALFFWAVLCHMSIPITVKANCDIKMFSHMNHNQVKIYLFSFYKPLWYFRWCLQNRIFFHSVSTCSFATTLIVSATETCSSSSISLFNRTSSLMNSSSWILFLIPYTKNIESMFGDFFNIFFVLYQLVLLNFFLAFYYNSSTI